MRLLCSVIVSLLCSSALAANQPVSYQDATLVSFRTVTTGSGYVSNGTVRATADEDGNVNGTSTSRSSCSDARVREYTILVSGSTYVVELAGMSAGKVAGATAAAMFTMGAGALLFRPHDILANQLPGSRVLIASHETGS